jgi:hypothetical protein
VGLVMQWWEWELPELDFSALPRKQQEKLSNSRSTTRHQDREAAAYRGWN